MNVPFIRDEWIPALRSGDYKQGNGELRSSIDEFCCLGLACELLAQQGTIPSWDERRYIEGKWDFLPDSAQDIIGCDAGGSFLDAPSGSFTESLAMMNDDGKSFAEIADYLESLITE